MIQFIATIRVRYNNLQPFQQHVGWLSQQIAKQPGWQLLVCSWQSPSPSPNDTEVVHVWNTPYNDALAARVGFNQILAELDPQRVANALATMASQHFLFAEPKTYAILTQVKNED